MLRDLLTNKISTNDANADQIPLVSNLMQEYDEDNLLTEGIKISAIKSESWKNNFLKKA